MYSRYGAWQNYGNQAGTLCALSTMSGMIQPWDLFGISVSFKAGGTADNAKMLIRPGIQNKVFRGFFICTDISKRQSEMLLSGAKDGKNIFLLL